MEAPPAAMITRATATVVTNIPAPVSAPRERYRPSPPCRMAARVALTSGAPLASARKVTPAKRGGRPMPSHIWVSTGAK